jgi:hypothetical protein
MTKDERAKLIDETLRQLEACNEHEGDTAGHSALSFEDAAKVLESFADKLTADTDAKERHRLDERLAYFVVVDTGSGESLSDRTPVEGFAKIIRGGHARAEVYSATHIKLMWFDTGVVSAGEYVSIGEAIRSFRFTYD